ncbi:hypothetical protein NVP1042O_53 [Vibrio phage 1.042.O._10N.286.45.B8]|nr:hypothetical protein NVP1042O_53 [Vibrio phage 1.042.O._10N.286.45.B8]
MAVKLTDEFGNRANPSSAAYPNGSLKDETNPGVSNDGSPLSNRVGNDFQGFMQSALTEAGIDANGNPDSVDNPQILEAVKSVVANNASNYTAITYTASGGNSAVENMIAGIPVKSKIGNKISTGLGSWERVSDLSGDISDFKPISINVFDFYKPSDGVTYDNAADRCFTYYKSQQSEPESATKISFPPFKFRINSLSYDDLYDTELDFNGALVFAEATQPTTAAIRIKNYNNIKVSNLGSLYSDHNPNYSYGVLFTGGAGGTIDPSVGLGKEMNFSNSSVLRFARGVKIGNETLDTNHGQNSLSNVHIKECNQGLIAAGSQTIVSVTGGSTAAGGRDVYGIPDQERIAVISMGGAVVLNSTEILKTSSFGYGVGITNCLSDTYENQYGSVIANGLYIETTAIARIYATGGSIARSSAKSCLSLNEVTGGVSGASRISVACVADDYSGRVDLGSGNIYGFGGARTAIAVDMGNSDAEVSLGKRFFRAPYFKSNLEEVAGGIMALDNDMIFRAQNLSAQTITTAGGSLKFTDVSAAGRFTRYSTIYSPSSGVVTIPKGGFLQMTIELGISSNTFDGAVRVLVNGTTRYNFYTDLRMDFSTTLYDLSEGDEVSIRVEPSSPVTFGSIATDYIQITATR